MRWLIIGIAVLTFAVAGAGCGGGDDEASADTTAITDTTTDETTTDETTTEETTEETTTEDTDTGTTDLSDLSGECLDAIQAYSAALAAAGSGSGDDNSLEVFQEFADRAPEEIRGDFQVLAAAYAKYMRAVGDINLQSGELPSGEDLAKLQAAAAAFDDPEVNAANQRVTTWADENC